MLGCDCVGRKGVEVGMYVSLEAMTRRIRHQCVDCCSIYV